LFEGLEEKFHFPAGFVERADRRSCQLEVVGEKDEPFSCVRFAVADAAECALVAGTAQARERDDLVGHEASCPVRLAALENLEAAVGFCAGDEADLIFVEAREPVVINVATVDENGIAGFKAERDFASDGDVVGASVGDDGELRQVASDIDGGVELGGALAVVKPRPRTEPEAKLDGRGIHGEDVTLEAEARGFGRDGCGTREYVFVGLLEDIEGSCRVGIGERAAPDGAEAQAIHRRIVLREHALDGADGIVSGELAEEKRAEPGPGVEGAHATVGVSMADPAGENRARNDLDDLMKNGILRQSLKSSVERKVCRKPFLTQSDFRLFPFLRYAPNRTAVELNTNKFKTGDEKVRASMAYSILKNQKALRGKFVVDLRNDFGRPDGFYFSDVFPAYMIQRGHGDQDESWQLVFLPNKERKVEDIIVHKNCCD